MYASEKCCKFSFIDKIYQIYGPICNVAGKTNYNRNQQTKKNTHPKSLIGAVFIVFVGHGSALKNVPWFQPNQIWLYLKAQQVSTKFSNA